MIFTKQEILDAINGRPSPATNYGLPVAANRWRSTRDPAQYPFVAVRAGKTVALEINKIVFSVPIMTVATVGAWIRLLGRQDVDDLAAVFEADTPSPDGAPFIRLQEGQVTALATGSPARSSIYHGGATVANSNPLAATIHTAVLNPPVTVYNEAPNPSNSDPFTLSFPDPVVLWGDAPAGAYLAIVSVVTNSEINATFFGREWMLNTEDFR